MGRRTQTASVVEHRSSSRAVASRERLALSSPAPKRQRRRSRLKTAPWQYGACGAGTNPSPRHSQAGCGREVAGGGCGLDCDLSSINKLGAHAHGPHPRGSVTVAVTVVAVVVLPRGGVAELVRNVPDRSGHCFASLTDDRNEYWPAIVVAVVSFACGIIIYNCLFKWYQRCPSGLPGVALMRDASFLVAEDISGDILASAEDPPLPALEEALAITDERSALPHEEPRPVRPEVGGSEVRAFQATGLTTIEELTAHRGEQHRLHDEESDEVEEGCHSRKARAMMGTRARTARSPVDPPSPVPMGAHVVLLSGAWALRPLGNRQPGNVVQKRVFPLDLSPPRLVTPVGLAPATHHRTERRRALCHLQGSPRTTGGGGATIGWQLQSHAWSTKPAFRIPLTNRYCA